MNHQQPVANAKARIGGTLANRYPTPHGDRVKRLLNPDLLELCDALLIYAEEE